jgi:voltage-gated potassium channel
MGRPADFRASGGYARWESNSDYVLIPLSLIFLVVLLLPLAVSLAPDVQRAFLVANILIWMAFAVDYFARLYLAPDRGRFVKTHVLDFIVIAVPFLRPLRLLRVFGIVGEYVTRSRRHLARRAMAFVGVVAVVAILAGASVIYNAEHSDHHSTIRSFPDALWWAVGTLSTVGTNVYPTTPTGRIVAAIMMISGVALAGIFTAAIATYFLASNDANRKAHAATNTEVPSVVEELGTVKESIGLVHTELNELRLLVAELTELQRGHMANGKMTHSTEEMERTDDVVH